MLFSFIKAVSYLEWTSNLQQMNKGTKALCLDSKVFKENKIKSKTLPKNEHFTDNDTGKMILINVMLFPLYYSQMTKGWPVSEYNKHGRRYINWKCSKSQNCCIIFFKINYSTLYAYLPSQNLVIIKHQTILGSLLQVGQLDCCIKRVGW